MVRPLALIVVGAAVVFGIGAGSLPAAPQQTPNAVKGELIVGFADGVSRADQNAILKDAGATSKKRFGQIDAVLVKVKDDEEATVTKLLSSEPRVAYVEPNHVVSIAATPNDPSFSQLWGLHNTGQTGGTNDKDIDAPEAWELATGASSIVVAVTDTGVDFSHPDLASQRWVNPLDPVGGGDDDGNGLVDDWSGWDFVNDDNDPFDDNRHGTHVSGTIGAAGNNGVGVVGVNWNVKIMALKFLNSAGSGSTADAISSTLYAADHGADVSSNSWGGGPYDQALLDAIEYGAARGMLFVAAAGNDGFNNDVTPTYPATYGSDAVLAVAATDHNDGLAFFSSYGAKSVDLGAPGVGILSTTPGNTYGSFDGTSMATPHVAGAAALVEDRFPGATLYGIKALLMNSVDPAASLAGKTVTGGRLNIGNALACNNAPKVVLGAPTGGFVVGVNDVIPIKVLGANCALPAGLGNVTATVNGTPVTLSATNPDTGLYTGSYTVSGQGALTVTATVTIGSSTDSETVSGNAFPNYTCRDAPFSWVDVTGVPPLSGADGDDAFSTLAIGFQVPFFGQSYGTAYISSNGFLTLGSSAGATAFANAAIPTTAAPNGVIAPFWDDLYPGGTGSVHAGVAGSPGSRVLHVEWFNVPHFSFSGSGTATFQVALHEATGEIRYQWLDTDLGNPSWNLGASATAGVERTDGIVGRQLSFNQPLLTNGKAVSCTFGAPPPPPPPPTITTTSLPGGAVGQSYSQTLAATGGTPPYTWSLDSGSFPAGLTLNPSTGAITGTPTAAGTSSFTAKVTDSATQTDTQALSIAVAAAPVPPPSITTTSLPGGVVGQPYSQTLAATGGATPFTWSLDSGSFPAGLTLNPSTGAITGTPTAAGTSSFTAKVTDSAMQSDTQALSIAVVVAPLAITTVSLPTGTVGAPYSSALAATGGAPPYTWSRISGKLPNGLALSASGVISGTPTKRGTYTFTVRVRDSLGTQVSKALSIQINRA
jgi:subtilisin family serine protease